ncbi:MAG TPA: protein-L-isoaspartate(D-aspartate) O-methyltransferase [Isosphaeraceae bacterium]|jgi:protein-L-isoaspartate(D-aspartate) O-methyltransferase|nr:protein-L-isoaspartate(D-aspartate) O-methyltransferase [Isosphaeraceae bacterium]
MKSRTAIVLGTAAMVMVLLSCSLVFVGAGSEESFRERRLRMVAEQIEARSIKDPAVLAAMRAVPRHRFVSSTWQSLAYDDEPLPIGGGQTISQPYVVALMTSLIRPDRNMRVLEIGTGSGYQAAVLASCVREVDSIEIVPDLGRQADRLLRELGFRNIHVRIGDGYAGWPERAPYDAIVLTAAPERVPKPLLDQLKVGGRLVAPVGKGVQDLQVITRTASGLTTQIVAPVKFVPMTGRAESDR